MIVPTVKSSRIQFLALVLAGLVSQPAHAGVIPGRWEKVSELEPGTTLRVELKNGDRIVGDLTGRSPSEVELDTYSAQAIIPKADIRRMSVLLPDDLGEGATIGAAIGVGLGTLSMAFRGKNSRDLPVGALGVLILGGLGAAMGAVVDSGTKDVAVVVYETPGNPQTATR